MKRFIAATVAALSLFTATAHAAVDQVRGLVMGDKSVTLVIPVAEAFKDGQLTPEARAQIRPVVDFGLTFNMRLSVTLPRTAPMAYMEEVQQAGAALAQYTASNDAVLVVHAMNTN